MSNELFSKEDCSSQREGAESNAVNSYKRALTCFIYLSYESLNNHKVKTIQNW